jgi:hypothetical protein
MGKVIYTENGKQVEKNFETEEEGQKIKAELKGKGIRGKFDW